MDGNVFTIARRDLAIILQDCGPTATCHYRGRVEPRLPLTPAGIMDRYQFSREYQAVYRRLWLVAAGITGNASIADDIVQESALIAYERMSEFREGSRFASWIGEIVRRTALNSRRKRVRRKTYAADPVELDQRFDETPTEAVSGPGHLSTLSSHIDDELLQALTLLPEEARCCLLLRVIDGLTYAEISELLAIPQGTAMSHVHRSKSFVRERLSKTRDAGAHRD